MQNKIFRFILPYTLILLTIRLTIDVIIKYFELGYQGESYGGLLAFVIELGFIFVTIKKLKATNNGSLKFTDGIKVGTALMLIVGLIFTLYISLIHNQIIDPTYQERLVAEATQKLLEQNPEADTSILKQDKDANTYIGIGFSVIKYILIGAIGGIISSAILKTEK